ncbi:hypothetical protein [Brevundimonas sp. Leaf363]|uniref:hypothetical protein n=1 Tax=Brevundimonas sp. Leaf363 TaxID=1736353 RepID=UPI000700D157|nr:hypothetical protein [Brevundimonas sp. Leaf363]
MTIDDMDEALRADPSIVAFTLTGEDWWALEAHQRATPNNEPGWGKGGLTHQGVIVGVMPGPSRTWTEAEWRETWGVLPTEFEMHLPRGL